MKTVLRNFCPYVIKPLMFHWVWTRTAWSCLRHGGKTSWILLSWTRNWSKFSFGQGSDTAVSAFTGRLSGNDYDLGLSLNGTNFFENFKKNPQEETLFNEFRDYLSFQLTAKAKESTGEVSLEGEYDYVKPVLNSDFGLRIAGKLDEFRNGSNSPGLSGAFGNFVEIFLQRLDYQTTIDLLGRIDLSKSSGFEGFDPDSIDTGSRLRGSSTGAFSLKVNSNESGGDSLCLMVDLLVAALNHCPLLRCLIGF